MATKYQTAYDLILDNNWIYDGYLVRLAGGRALYDGAEITRNGVMLNRIDPHPDNTHLIVVRRYVMNNQPIELVHKSEAKNAR